MDQGSEDVIQIPLDFAANLKCIVCNGYLSVPPIVSGNNGKNVCGRCDFITYNKQERRNVIYEDVAKLMTFPCVFDKCTKRIPWGEVEKHEKLCPYHTIMCPKKDCHENVLVRELVSHFTWQHKFEKASSITVANFDIHQPAFDSPQLLICNEKPFLVFCYRSESFLGVGVYSLDPSDNQNVRYFVALTSNNGILIKGRQKIQPFSGRLHCAECFENKCTKKYHKYSLNYKNNSFEELHNSLATKFEIDSVKKILEADRIVFKVSLSDVGDAHPQFGKKRKLADVSITGSSECETCRTLLALPESSCKMGVSLLEAIKLQVKQCSCKSDMKDILEDFNIVDLIDGVKEENLAEDASGKENGDMDATDVIEEGDSVIESEVSPETAKEK